MRSSSSNPSSDDGVFVGARTKNLEDIGSQLVLALEASYRSLQEDHAEIPSAVIVINSGGNVKYGHFAQSRWDVKGTKLPEIMISAEGLKRPPRLVLATLIHEAAHGVAFTRGVDDVSKGKYHNKKFKAIAEELGLVVQQHPDRVNLGHSNTILPEGGYETLLAELTPKLVAWREFDPTPKAKISKREREINFYCGCTPKRTLRMLPSQYQKFPVFCGGCEYGFE